MNIRPIRSQGEYEEALERAAELMGAKPNTPEADELDILATLIERYEDEHEPVPAPDPIDAILFRLEQTGRTPQDLKEILGTHRGRVSEILNRKRRLSLEMIRTLSDKLHIPAEILIQTEATPNTPRVVWGHRRVLRSRLGSRAKELRLEERPSVMQRESKEPLPDLVEAHLRAERKLDPDAAEALSQMFRIAYDQFASRSIESTPPASSDEPGASNEAEGSQGDPGKGPVS